MSKPRRHRAENGLGAAGAKLWREHVADTRYEPHELALVRRAAKIADRIAVLEETLEGEGVTVPGSLGQPVLHPAYAEIRNLEKLLADLLFRIPFNDAKSNALGLTRSQNGRRAAFARHHGGKTWP